MKIIALVIITWVTLFSVISSAQHGFKWTTAGIIITHSILCAGLTIERKP